MSAPVHPCVEVPCSHDQEALGAILAGARPIDPDAVGCPCCGDTPWCAAEVAVALVEVRAAPLLVMGSAMYGRLR